MLKHKNLRNIGVATSFGKITFDSEGLSDDLTEEQQKELGKLHNFEYLSEEDLKEKMEDEMDLKRIKEYEADLKEGKIETYTYDEVVEELEEEESEEVEEFEEGEVVEEEESEEVEEVVEVKEYGDITLAKIKEELTDLGVDYNEKGTKKELYEVYKEELTK